MKLCCQGMPQRASESLSSLMGSGTSCMGERSNIAALPAIEIIRALANCSSTMVL